MLSFKDFFKKRTEEKIIAEAEDTESSGENISTIKNGRIIFSDEINSYDENTKKVLNFVQSYTEKDYRRLESFAKRNIGDYENPKQYLKHLLEIDPASDGIEITKEDYKALSKMMTIVNFVNNKKPEITIPKKGGNFKSIRTIKVDLKITSEFENFLYGKEIDTYKGSDAKPWFVKALSLVANKMGNLSQNIFNCLTHLNIDKDKDFIINSGKLANAYKNYSSKPNQNQNNPQEQKPGTEENKEGKPADNEENEEKKPADNEEKSDEKAEETKNDKGSFDNALKNGPSKDGDLKSKWGEINNKFYDTYLRYRKSLIDSWKRSASETAVKWLETNEPPAIKQNEGIWTPPADSDTSDNTDTQVSVTTNPVMEAMIASNNEVLKEALLSRGALSAKGASEDDEGMKKSITEALKRLDKFALANQKNAYDAYIDAQKGDLNRKYDMIKCLSSFQGKANTLFVQLTKSFEKGILHKIGDSAKSFKENMRKSLTPEEQNLETYFGKVYANVPAGIKEGNQKAKILNAFAEYININKKGPDFIKKLSLIPNNTVLPDKNGEVTFGEFKNVLLNNLSGYKEEEIENALYSAFKKGLIKTNKAGATDENAAAFGKADPNAANNQNTQTNNASAGNNANNDFTFGNSNGGDQNQTTLDAIWKQLNSNQQGTATNAKTAARYMKKFANGKISDEEIEKYVNDKFAKPQNSETLGLPDNTTQSIIQNAANKNGNNGDRTTNADEDEKRRQAVRDDMNKANKQRKRRKNNNQNSNDDQRQVGTVTTSAADGIPQKVYRRALKRRITEYFY